MPDKMSIPYASVAYPLPTPARDASAVNSNTCGAYALTRTNPTSSEKLLKPGFIQRAKSLMSRIGKQPVYVADVAADQRAIAAEMRSSIYREMHREIEIAWERAKSAGIDSCHEKNVEIIRNAISHQIDNMATKYKEVYDRAYMHARSSPENFVLASLLSAHKPALRAVKRYQQNMWLPQQACSKAASIFRYEMYNALAKFTGRHINHCEAIVSKKSSIEAFEAESGYESDDRSSMSSEVQPVQPEPQPVSSDTVKTRTHDRSWETWAAVDRSQFD